MGLEGEAFLMMAKEMGQDTVEQVDEKLSYAVEMRQNAGERVDVRLFYNEVEEANGNLQKGERQGRLVHVGEERWERIRRWTGKGIGTGNG